MAGRPFPRRGPSSERSLGEMLGCSGALQRAQRRPRGCGSGHLSPAPPCPGVRAAHSAGVSTALAWAWGISGLLVVTQDSPGGAESSASHAPGNREKESNSPVSFGAGSLGTHFTRPPQGPLVTTWGKRTSSPPLCHWPLPSSVTPAVWRPFPNKRPDSHSRSARAF